MVKKKIILLAKQNAANITVLQILSLYLKCSKLLLLDEYSNTSKL